jgi:hypothetical protein
MSDPADSDYAIPLDPIPLETVQERFARTQRLGAKREVDGEDGRRTVPYSISEGVWRPDGRGANQTIYSSFDWKGKKVRALKPVPKFRKGEQWLRPQQENNDEYIGIMTGDSRLVGNTAMTSKFSGVKVGEEIPGSDDRIVRRYPLNFNVLSNQQLYSKNRGGGGAVGDAIYGVDERTIEKNARRDEVLGILSQDEANVSVGKPLPFLKMNIEAQTAGQLEDYVTDERVSEFLNDPVANFAYSDWAMAATPGTIYVNTSGDANAAGGDNLGGDREWVSFSNQMRTFGERKGEGVRGGPEETRAGAAFSTTLNAVKVNSKDMQMINTYGEGDSRTVQDFETSDTLAPKVNVAARNQVLTTKNLFNRNTRAPDLGRNDASLEQDKRILAMSRRYRRKEQDQGMMQPSFAGEAQDKRDQSILSMSRRYRRKEQDQGMMQPSFAGEAQDKRDQTILSMSRRYRRKEQDQGMMQPSFAGEAQDKRDQSVLAMSRRYRRKEQDQGMMQPSFAGEAQDKRDQSILAMSRRYRRKELDVVNGVRFGSEINVHGDMQSRDPRNRRKDAETMRTMSAALFPEATISGGEVAGKDMPILSENPIQKRKGVERTMQTAQSGVGRLGSTETEQYAVQNRIDPSAPELLSRTTQQVNLRDRSTSQGAIGVINVEESNAVRAAYQRDFTWMAPRQGKLGQPAMYQSEGEGGEAEGGESEGEF